MKTKYVLLGICSFAISCFFVEKTQAQQNSLWGKKQTIRSCRLTAFQKGNQGKDKNSRKNQSSSGVELTYATLTSVGTAAAPSRVPLWSLVRVKVPGGVLLAVVVDRGTDVDSEKASAKNTDKSPRKKSLVIDICAPTQSWKDFTQVELFPYTGPLNSEGKPRDLDMKTLFNKSFVEKATY